MMHMMMDVKCLDRFCKDCDCMDLAVDTDVYFAGGDTKLVGNQIYCRNLPVCEHIRENLEIEMNKKKRDDK